MPVTHVRSIVMHDIPINAIAGMERWYYKDHSPEIVRRFGPWEHRHDSYMPVDAPADARAFGFYNWRVTDGWWREIPKPGPQGDMAFTPPPAHPKVSTCFIPWQPTEDFLGWEVKPHDKHVLRWFVMFKYPEGVSFDEGEKWFLDVHVPEVKKQKKLYRFFSYKVVKEKIALPGNWAPDSLPDRTNLFTKWDRVCELWYEGFDDWRESVITSPPNYTKPAWASHPTYPFLKPHQDFVCSYLLERPVDEFLRDSRSYL